MINIDDYEIISDIIDEIKKDEIINNINNTNNKKTKKKKKKQPQPPTKIKYNHHNKR